MRPGVDTIPAPPFPRDLRWVNTAALRMDKQRGRPVLVEFWDFCRVHSLRTLPYVQAWHDRYGGDGLRVIGVHTAGFQASSDPDAAAAACSRLGVEHPVVLDERREIWGLYGNRGWPARYLFGADGMLCHYHYGQGAYDETELAIQELLERDGPLLEPLRPEDEPGTELVPQTDDQPGAWNGPYAAGGVHGVLTGAGAATANGVEIRVAGPGCYPLVEHEWHTEGVLDLRLGEGVGCEAVCFTPGRPAPAPAR